MDNQCFLSLSLAPLSRFVLIAQQDIVPATDTTKRQLCRDGCWWIYLGQGTMTHPQDSALPPLASTSQMWQKGCFFIIIIISFWFCFFVFFWRLKGNDTVHVTECGSPELALFELSILSTGSVSLNQEEEEEEDRVDRWTQKREMDWSE